MLSAFLVNADAKLTKSLQKEKRNLAFIALLNPLVLWIIEAERIGRRAGKTFHNVHTLTYKGF